MKPHVCPKCEGEALRMMNCAPCKGAGIVWSPTADPILAPNPYVAPYVYPYFIPTPTVGPQPPQITWGGTVELNTTPGTFEYTSDGPVTFSTALTLSGSIQ